MLTAVRSASVSPSGLARFPSRNRREIAGTRAAPTAAVGAHDALFKHVFSVPEHAAAELAHVLPTELSSRIAWPTLRLEPGSFVEPELASSHTDLLFSATLRDGRRAYVYLLFEHQSAPHPWMPLRMVEYVAKVLRAAQTRAPRARLPLVIPVVLHHASVGWAEARSMRELYDADEPLLRAIGERALHLRIEVDDLAAEPWTAIAARPMPALVRVVLGLLRDARDHDLPELFSRWGALMIEAARAAGSQALAAAIHYLVRVRRIEDPSVLLAAVRERGGSELEVIAMNALDKLRAEGKAEGKAELLLRQLRLRFGELAPELVARVRGATGDDLDAMAERILTAHSAADVVG